MVYFVTFIHVIVTNNYVTNIETKTEKILFYVSYGDRTWDFTVSSLAEELLTLLPLRGLKQT